MTIGMRVMEGEVAPMPEERSPEEIAMERLLADPGLMQRRLDRDLTEVAELGRSGVRVNPGADGATLVEALRSQAEQLEFDAPIVVATQTKRRLVELPSTERTAGTPIQAYSSSASLTVREGALVEDRISRDGSRFLVFERQGSEAGMARVTLSAEVWVESDGRTFLESYGWPAPPGKPVHTFDAGPEQLLDQALSDLADTEVPLDRPLLLLWGARLQEGDPSGDARQRMRLAELVVARAGELNAYVSRADDYATGSAEQWWYAACLYRSTLENLFESYLGGATFSLVSAEELDDLDEELRESLTQAQGTPDAVPAGAPEGHWWWRTSVGQGD